MAQDTVAENIISLGELEKELYQLTEESVGIPYDNYQEDKLFPTKGAMNRESQSTGEISNLVEARFSQLQGHYKADIVNLERVKETFLEGILPMSIKYKDYLKKDEERYSRKRINNLRKHILIPGGILTAGLVYFLNLYSDVNMFERVCISVSCFFGFLWGGEYVDKRITSLKERIFRRRFNHLKKELVEQSLKQY